MRPIWGARPELPVARQFPAYCDSRFRLHEFVAGGWPRRLTPREYVVGQTAKRRRFPSRTVCPQRVGFGRAVSDSPGWQADLGSAVRWSAVSVAIVQFDHRLRPSRHSRNSLASRRSPRRSAFSRWARQSCLFRYRLRRNASGVGCDMPPFVTGRGPEFRREGPKSVLSLPV